MRWEDERYVRLYTRDTVEWNLLCWQARAILPLILRKVDRAGLLEVGRRGSRGLAANLQMPVEVVERGLEGDPAQSSSPEGLIASGSVELRDGVLVVPKFIEAQEATACEALRAREYRARARDLARADKLGIDVTSRAGDITPRDESSRNTRNRHSDPCRTEPSEETRSPSAAPPSAPLSLLPMDDPETGQKPHRFAFEAVYAVFPRKRGKSDGLRRLERDVRTQADFDALITAVRNFAAEMQREQRPIDKIAYFSTWVGEWKDWIQLERGSDPAEPPMPRWVAELAAQSEEERKNYRPRFWTAEVA